MGHGHLWYQESWRMVYLGEISLKLLCWVHWVVYLAGHVCLYSPLDSGSPTFFPSPPFLRGPNWHSITTARDPAMYTLPRNRHWNERASLGRVLRIDVYFIRILTKYHFSVFKCFYLIIWWNIWPLLSLYFHLFVFYWLLFDDCLHTSNKIFILNK